MRKTRLNVERYTYGLPEEGPLWQIAGSSYEGSGNQRIVIGRCTLEDLAALGNDIAALLAGHTQGEVFAPAQPPTRRDAP